MVAEANQRREDLEKNGRVDLVDLFPGGVGDPVRSRGRCGRALGQSIRYLFLGQGGAPSPRA